MWKFIRRHSLPIIVAIIGFLCLLTFSWAEYGYFCDQAKSHKEPCTSFTSKEHMHDWVYNMTSNWQSDMFFGTLTVIILKDMGAKDEKTKRQNEPI